jgi:hypothetical protein
MGQSEQTVDAAPAPGKIFYAALAPAPTLLYSKPKFLKGKKLN